VGGVELPRGFGLGVGVGIFGTDRILGHLLGDDAADHLGRAQAADLVLDRQGGGARRRIEGLGERLLVDQLVEQVRQQDLVGHLTELVWQLRLEQDQVPERDLDTADTGEHGVDLGVLSLRGSAGEAQRQGGDAGDAGDFYDHRGGLPGARAAARR
jgi:hypothetical protein